MATKSRYPVRRPADWPGYCLFSPQKTKYYLFWRARESGVMALESAPHPPARTSMRPK